ncbi:DUF962 domain-containing protein [Chitinivorax sp. B]|uniref:DUF962 domain-containing protein n=1 Tax=Chitinivorax sp. B TaxID=2502235 RepID=UPI0010F436D4|nr:DUF962 domain-containing protein [Chitinivorax sp. B]
MTSFRDFNEFYPVYLQAHQTPACRRLHFIGSSLVLGIVLYAIIYNDWWSLLLAPFAGYGCAWIGHFVFEKNRPVTFGHPLYSFMGDWVMYWQMLTGRIAF